jgi:peptide-methionine (S)-S-oxide reductase
MIRRALLIAVLLAGCGQSAGGQAGNAAAPAPKQAQARDSGQRATAILAGGCFWSTEAALEPLPGVVNVVSGFAGGGSANPTYEQVTGGRTGHLEAVQVTFDPTRISYGALVRRFLVSIDPTDDGGQFCDRGPNYRTAIFAMDAAQRRDAQTALAGARRVLGRAPVTPVLGPARFFAAADHHQDYARRNPGRYNQYKVGCGRDARLRQVWGNRAAG